jgi:hypothetical protein
MTNESQAPTKKVSEIFLRYVAPLLDEAPTDVSPEYLKRCFVFPIAIWNAVAMKSWGKSQDYVKEIVDQLTKNGDAETSRVAEPLVRFWLQRKNELFPNENWGIEDVVTYRDFNGELISRVIARAPEEFKHQLPSNAYVRNHQTTLN